MGLFMAGKSERSSYIDAFGGFALLGVLSHHSFYHGHLGEACPSS
jgi:hypothetical protein